MKRPSKSVSFRLSADILELLDERSKETNLSRGDVARTLVIHGLVSADSEQLATSLKVLGDRVAEVEKVTSHLEKTLAYHLYFVLVKLGEYSSEDAQEIVRKEFLAKVGKDRK